MNVPGLHDRAGGFGRSGALSRDSNQRIDLFLIKYLWHTL
jgi:hypothetical protein